MKVAVHGLGRMGMQIARKLVEGGHNVIAFNRSPEPIAEIAAQGAHPAYTKDEVVQQIGTERAVVWVMLPAEITDDEIAEWSALLPAQSIVVNGGNSDYRKTQQLNEVVNASGHILIDVGVSGGIWGYERGFSLMAGSDEQTAFEYICPLLESLRLPYGAYALLGPSGAGHYTKMVHNAIEYGMMQSLGEGYQLLHEGPYKDINLHTVSTLWQHQSVISSYLNDLSAQIFAENHQLEGISGYVAESGEARWALETAHQLKLALPCIEQAYAVRLATHTGNVSFATKLVAAQRTKFGGHNLNGEGAA